MRLNELAGLVLQPRHSEAGRFGQAVLDVADGSWGLLDVCCRAVHDASAFSRCLLSITRLFENNGNTKILQ
jgi:hypothetical protein